MTLLYIIVLIWASYPGLASLSAPHLCESHLHHIDYKVQAPDPQLGHIMSPTSLHPITKFSPSQKLSP